MFYVPTASPLGFLVITRFSTFRPWDAYQVPGARSPRHSTTATLHEAAIQQQGITSIDQISRMNEYQSSEKREGKIPRHDDRDEVAPQQARRAQYAPRLVPWSMSQQQRLHVPQSSLTTGNRLRTGHQEQDRSMARPSNMHAEVTPDGKRDLKSSPSHLRPPYQVSKMLLQHEPVLEDRPSLSTSQTAPTKQGAKKRRPLPSGRPKPQTPNPKPQTTTQLRTIHYRHQRV